ncbi:hypothetical protein HW132_34440 [Brasilonema sp. CT11]|nr:hypothetical protein [Brasilonema sp. CT11]
MLMWSIYQVRSADRRIRQGLSVLVKIQGVFLCIYHRIHHRAANSAYIRLLPQLQRDYTSDHYLRHRVGSVLDLLYYHRR